MAKTIKDIDQPTRKSTAATETTQSQDKPNTPVSVYLPEHEKKYIENIADKLGVSRHSVLQYAVRYFIDQDKAGNVKIETETTTQIKA